MTALDEAASAVRARAQALAEARTQEAHAFLRAKMSITDPRTGRASCTDAQAERMACVETHDAVTIARAEYEIAVMELRGVA